MESVRLRGRWSTEPGGATQVRSEGLISTFNHSVPAVTNSSTTVEESRESMKSLETPSIMDYCRLEKDGRMISQHALLHRDDEVADRLSVSKNKKKF